jgi:hypothetical protein
VKLFQIEEPDGAPLEVDGPGAAVGIHLAAEAAIAFSVGGNAEILGRAVLGDPLETLLALRGQAEKMLSRPVTHAVIAAEKPVKLEAAGLALLRHVSVEEAARLGGGSAALGAAILAEDLAPPAS